MSFGVRMRITKLEISNFKSIDKVSLEFGNLSVMVGANAAGKSNVISALKFVNNIMVHGIDDAISLAGGIEYVANMAFSRERPIAFSVTIDFSNDGAYVVDDEKTTALKLEKVNSQFEIKRKSRGNGYRTTDDKMQLIYTVSETDKSKKSKKIGSIQGHATFTLNKASKTISLNTNYEKSPGSDKEISREQLEGYIGINYLKKLNIFDNELLLSLLHFFHPVFRPNLIKVYDFDSKVLKKSSAMESKKSLNEDGSNLASILQRIIKKDKGEKEKMNRYIQHFLPFAETINIERNTDSTISYMLYEKYLKKNMPSTYISDGTAAAIALTIVLYYDTTTKSIVVEEPERNIHPELIEKIVESFKEVSKKKQIILTTHSPEIVGAVGIDSILLVKRDSSGFTEVVRPADSEVVKEFLNNELGIDRLFINGLLGE